VLSPSDPTIDQNKFTFCVDGGNCVVDGVNGSTTGQVTVSSGQHSLSIAAGTGTSLANYVSPIQWTGDCSPQTGTSVVLTVGQGDNKSCTVTLVENPVQAPPSYELVAWRWQQANVTANSTTTWISRENQSPSVFVPGGYGVLRMRVCCENDQCTPQQLSVEVSDNGVSYVALANDGTGSTRLRLGQNGGVPPTMPRVATNCPTGESGLTMPSGNSCQGNAGVYQRINDNLASGPLTSVELLQDKCTDIAVALKLQGSVSVGESAFARPVGLSVPCTTNCPKVITTVGSATD
jgi:hypothetical protein